MNEDHTILQWPLVPVGYLRLTSHFVCAQNATCSGLNSFRVPHISAHFPKWSFLLALASQESCPIKGILNNDETPRLMARLDNKRSLFSCELNHVCSWYELFLWHAKFWCIPEFLYDAVKYLPGSPELITNPELVRVLCNNKRNVKTPV